MGTSADVIGNLMPIVFRNAGVLTPLELDPTLPSSGEIPLLFDYSGYPSIPAVGSEAERRFRLYVESIGSIDLILDIEFKSTTEFEVIPKFSEQIFDPDGSAEQALQTSLTLSSIVKTDSTNQARKILAPLEMDIESALWTPRVGSRGLVTLNFITPSVKWIQFFIKETSAVDPGAGNRAVLHGLTFVIGQGVS